MIRSFLKTSSLFKPQLSSPRVFYLFSTGGQNQDPSASNPFFNPQAAAVKKGMNEGESKIKEWQERFKAKHGRKPTMEEMKRDPDIGPILAERDAQKQLLRETIRAGRMKF